MTLASTLNYREYILEKVRQNKNVRGYRSQLAKAASCHSSYFSHILKGEAQLTPDQAAALSDFWHLNKRDSEYFITLVNLERASTPSLQKKLRERLNELRQIDTELPSVEVADVKMTYEQAVLYFSSWYMSAIHRALDIPELRTTHAISSHLSLPFDLVEKALESLQDMKLAYRNGHDWKSNDKGFHLNRNRELMGAFHSSLRNRARYAYDRSSNNNVHFSAVIAISKKDSRELHDAIKKKIADATKICLKSQPEELVGVTVDYFVF